MKHHDTLAYKNKTNASSGMEFKLVGVIWAHNEPDLGSYNMSCLFSTTPIFFVYWLSYWSPFETFERASWWIVLHVIVPEELYQ